MDENITNFQGSVKIPNEIRDVKNTIMYGLTGRQIGSSTLAIVVIVINVLLLSSLLHIDPTISIVVGILFAAPIFAFGFYRPGKLPLEDWLLIQYSNKVKSAPVRKLSAENAYETAVRLGEKKMKEDEAIKKKAEKKEKGKGKGDKKTKDESTTCSAGLRGKRQKSSYKFRK